MGIGTGFWLALKGIIYGPGAHDSNPQSHNSQENRRGMPPYLRKDLEIRGIYLPYIGFFVVLGLFEWVLKPYHPLAAFISGMVSVSSGLGRSVFYDN